MGPPGEARPPGAATLRTRTASSCRTSPVPASPSAAGAQWSTGDSRVAAGRMTASPRRSAQSEGARGDPLHWAVTPPPRVAIPLELCRWLPCSSPQPSRNRTARLSVCFCGGRDAFSGARRPRFSLLGTPCWYHRPNKRCSYSLRRWCLFGVVAVSLAEEQGQ